MPTTDNYGASPPMDSPLASSSADLAIRPDQIQYAAFGTPSIVARFPDHHPSLRLAGNLCRRPAPRP
ncbi:uncharacterized protein LDX57_000448 [Aspergillus melleus]|uniref:uncharacterized protein n=1 Tax=Aspergillus melleus TaxID=138277 RepID=UPI001E8D1D35|nr:uncharacterized protein LDX57_000448 [Aspergillus melleus]KAH8422694.1 hypothetical protein LDX57_000448 [Aspergillus melleus]